MSEPPPATALTAPASRAAAASRSSWAGSRLGMAQAYGTAGDRRLSPPPGGSAARGGGPGQGREGRAGQGRVDAAEPRVLGPPGGGGGHDLLASAGDEVPPH